MFRTASGDIHFAGPQSDDNLENGREIRAERCADVRIALAINIQGYIPDHLLNKENMHFNTDGGDSEQRRIGGSLEPGRFELDKARESLWNRFNSL
jgi:hypothetical protein